MLDCQSRLLLNCHRVDDSESRHIYKLLLTAVNLMGGQGPDACSRSMFEVGALPWRGFFVLTEERSHGPNRQRSVIRVLIQCSTPLHASFMLCTYVLCISVNKQINKQVVYIYVYTWRGKGICIGMYVCVYICMCLLVYARIYVYNIHVHAHVYVYLHVYVYVYVYVYVHVCMHV